MIRRFTSGIFRAWHPVLQGISWMHFPGRAETPDDLFKEAGLEDQNDVVVETGDGYVTYRRANAAAAADSETDRALLLKLLAVGAPDWDQLIGAKVCLYWKTGEPSLADDTSMILIPNSTIVKIDNGLLWLVDIPGNSPTVICAKNIVHATTTWTSIGKPENERPPRPELYL